MITFINKTKIRNDVYVKEDFRATENITYITADNQPKQKSMLMMKNTEQVLLAMKPLPPPLPQFSALYRTIRPPTYKTTSISDSQWPKRGEDECFAFF